MRFVPEVEPKKRGRPPLTPELTQEVTRLYVLTNHSVDEIAKITGVSRTKCFAIARDLNATAMRLWGKSARAGQ